MRLINKTKITTISSQIVEAKTWKQKVFGLTIAHNPYPICFNTHLGIHTFGMKYAIDVLILNKESIVVKVKQNLEPNRVLLWNPIYSTVIELPTGTIKNTQTKTGDYIVFN